MSASRQKSRSCLKESASRTGARATAETFAMLRRRVTDFRRCRRRPSTLVLVPVPFRIPPPCLILRDRHLATSSSATSESRRRARSVASGAARIGVRPARPQRRRQDDDDPHDPRHHPSRLGNDLAVRQAEHRLGSMLDRIGYLPEERGLYKKMQVAPRAAVPRRAEGRARQGSGDPRIDEWLERFELSRPPTRTGATRRSTSSRAACSRRCSSSPRCCTIPIS